MITRRGAVTTACVVLFWMVAAVLVHSIPRGVTSPLGGGAATIAVLVATAFAYMRLTARDAGVTHALGVGVAWLVLSMSVEIGMARYLGHPW